MWNMTWGHRRGATFNRVSTARFRLLMGCKPWSFMISRHRVVWNVNQYGCIILLIFCKGALSLTRKLVPYVALLGEHGVAAVIGHGLPFLISLYSLRHKAKKSLHYRGTIPIVARFQVCTVLGQGHAGIAGSNPPVAVCDNRNELNTLKGPIHPKGPNTP